MDTQNKPNATPAEPTYAELLAKVRELERKENTVDGIRIGEKGGVSVYGIGRFPVTLYFEQWQALAAKMPKVLAFIEANRTNPLMKAKPAKA